MFLSLPLCRKCLPYHPHTSPPPVTVVDALTVLAMILARNEITGGEGAGGGGGTKTTGDTFDAPTVCSLSCVCDCVRALWVVYDVP